MFHNNDNGLKAKDKLLALKVIIDSNETKFALFERGPNNLITYDYPSITITIINLNGIC
jgi:hypothetical protein